MQDTIAKEMSKFIGMQASTNTQVSDRVKQHDSEILLLSEESDAAMNQANQHIILVTGLKAVLKKDRKDKLKQAQDAAREFLDAISSGKVDIMFVTFIPGPPPQPGCLPMLKLAFGSNGDAHHVKNKFNEYRRQNPRVGNSIYLTPEQTRSTRVRAAILVALARKKQVQQFVKDTTLQVTRFEIKPDLCYRHPKSGKIERRVSFKEACDRFLSLLTGDDLLIAKKIAGKALGKRLKSLFNLN